MLDVAPLGRSLPRPPSAFEVESSQDDDIRYASDHPTPRPPRVVNHLERRVLSKTQLTKYWIASSLVAFALWMVGTATAIVLMKLQPAWGTKPLLAFGFGGIGLGLVVGAIWIFVRKREARRIAREGQLVVGMATYDRSRASFAGDLTRALAAPLGDTRYCIVFSIGFIKHEMWVAFPVSPRDHERHQVLVQPGARRALAFDRTGRGYVGDVRVRS